MLNLIGNLHEHLNKFQTYRHIALESARKLNPLFFFFLKRNFANKMGILLHFKRLFHDQSYLSVIVIHVQLYSSLTFLVQETASKKKTGRINLTNTWQALLQHISKIKHNSPDSIQKNLDELIC